MKRFLRWAVLTAVLTVAYHLLGVWCIPRCVTLAVVHGIFADEPPINRMVHSGLRYAGQDLVVRSNPDMIVSFAVYDVSKTPVRVKGVIPETDNYWSISLFALNTDNFFVLNDRKAKTRDFELVIVNDDSDYRPQGTEQVVVSPSDRGIVLIRLIVSDRKDEQEIASLSEVQKLTSLEALGP
jgi:uncharacterized membrane protein